jgi:hypothetical protein
MIAHLVTFTWTDGTDPADVAALGDELSAMAAGIPSLAFYRCGANLRLRPNGADFAVLAVAADQAALEAYLDAPAHLDILARSILPYVGTRQAVQIDIGDDVPEAWRV